ncbi:MAG: PaaI family thioesterase [Rhodobacteraceae bacterium]|nr:PaaI family thioesterase [Paracoccaceae bacterium]
MKMDADALRAFLKSEFRQVADMFAIDAVQPGDITVRLLHHERHLRPGGTVSGPAMFALADVAVYLAILSQVGPKALSVTTNCAIDFMRKPAAGVDLVCTARLLKLGRVLAVGDCLIYSQGLAQPVARASLTYSIPPEK